MRLLIGVSLFTLCFVQGAMAQQINVRQLKSQAAQIFREYENQIHDEAMVEFDEMDANKDGYLDKNEFFGAAGVGSDQQKSKAFKMMDSNNDGRLTKNEMWSFVKNQVDSF